MKGLIDAARQVSFRRATTTTDIPERNALQNAVRLLNHHEPFLCRRFPELLLADFSSSAAAEPQRAAAAGAFSFENLELMDDAQVQERVEVARVQQAILQSTEVELSELNRLICGAQGLDNVIAERNPMRPEVYARTLRAVLTQTNELPQVRIIWMHAMSGTFGIALAETYRVLCGMLRDAGIAPAGYLVTKGYGVASEGAAAVPMLPASLLRVAGTMGAVSGSQNKLLTLEHLRRLVAGDPASQNNAPGVAENPFSDPMDRAHGHQEFSQTVPAAFETLREMKQVDTVMKRLASRQLDGAGDAGPAPGSGLQGRQPVADPKDSRSLGQALALEVVSLMVDNIAGDVRLVEPVRVAVKALQPALLSLALKDPRFFSHREHPARRLLSEIAQRGLGFDSVDSEGFEGFIEPVQSAVEGLVSIKVNGPEPFEVALAALHEEWAAHVAQEQKSREKAVQALVQAEKRTLLANQISREMRERVDVQRAAPEVVALLVGPWSQVMAQARLSHPEGGADPGGYGAMVIDLLWSSRPELARCDRAGLVRMIPRLIETLRKGLRSIDYPPSREEQFFDALIDLHQLALAPVAPPKENDSVSPMSRSELDACFELADEAGLWMVGEEARDTGYFDSMPLPRLDAVALPDETAPMLLRSEPAAPEANFDALTLPGAWIERLVEGKWTRSQLTWSSPQLNLFMYTSVSGGAQSMTLNSLRRLYDDGLVRLVADQPLVDGALDEVARTALRNSVEGKR